MKRFVSIFWALASLAQSPYDKSIQWFAYNADHAITKKWALHFDSGWRETNESPWSQWLVRPGVNYQVNKQLQLSAAYSYFSTYPLGLSVGQSVTPEHRLQEQAQYSQALGRVTIRHRVRVDHWILGSGRRPDYSREWNTQHRYRYMLRAEVPLRRFRDDGPSSMPPPTTRSSSGPDSPVPRTSTRTACTVDWASKPPPALDSSSASSTSASSRSPADGSKTTTSSSPRSATRSPSAAFCASNRNLARGCRYPVVRESRLDLEHPRLQTPSFCHPRWPERPLHVPAR